MAAVVDGVVVGVVAPDEDRGDADVDVVEERLRHRFRRADQRRRVAAGAGRGGQRGPQRPVVQLALGGGGQQPLRADVLRLVAAEAERLRAPLGAEGGDVLLGGLEDAVGALPGEFLGRAEDRPEADARCRAVSAAAGVLGGRVDRVDLLLGLGQRLAPQGVGVGVLAADPVGRLGRAAEVQPDPVLLGRLDAGLVVLDLVVLAVVAERLVGRPGQPDDVEVLVGAGVALVLGQVVAVAGAARRRARR